MKYTINWLIFGRASKGWTLEIEVRYPIESQVTWVCAKYENTDTNLKPSKSIIITFLKFWWLIRKEVKLRQESER